MKKLMIFLFFAMQFTALRAQTVSIGCDGTTNCFLVDPCISPTTYIHVINDGNLGTNNGYTRVISWDAVGDYSSRVAAGIIPLMQLLGIFNLIQHWIRLS
jgi:hypothetical protein